MSRPTVNGMLIDTALDTTRSPMDIARGFLSGFASAIILRKEDAVFPFSANDAGMTRERTEGLGPVGNGGGVSGFLDGESSFDSAENTFVDPEAASFVAAGAGEGWVARSLCVNATRDGSRRSGLVVVWRRQATERALNCAWIPSIKKKTR